VSRRIRDWTGRVGATLLLAAGLVVPAGTSPVAAAVVASLPPDCQVGAGATGTVGCFTISTAPPAGLRSSATAAASTDCGFETWTAQTRLAACQTFLGTYQKFLVPSGALVGWIVVVIRSSVNTAGPQGSHWNHILEYQPDDWWGQVGTTTLRTARRCVTACRFLTQTQPPSGPATSRHTGTELFDSSGSAGTRWTAKSEWDFWFEDPNTVNKVTRTVSTGYPGHRCDDQLPGAGPGCVQSSFKPHLALRGTNYPNYREHIRAAQLFTKLPHELNRTTNRDLETANRRVSCPPSSPTYPRPAGYECDEYPFASTYQGAFGRNGEGFSLKLSNRRFELDCRVSWLPTQAQTPHRGYSACMIPASENSSGGGELGAFYRANRIIDGDPFTVLRK
jgi:hypothetical protein